MSVEKEFYSFLKILMIKAREYFTLSPATLPTKIRHVLPVITRLQTRNL